MRRLCISAIVSLPAIAHADVGPSPAEGMGWLIVSLAFTYGGIEAFRWLRRRKRSRLLAGLVALVIIVGGDAAALFGYAKAHPSPPHRLNAFGR